MKKRSGGRKLLRFAAFIFAALMLFDVLLARIVKIEPVQYELADLDSRLSGLNILYVTDLNMRSLSSAKRLARLVNKLCDTQPDLLVLSGSLVYEKTPAERVDEMLYAFFSRLADIRCPLGKYVVYGSGNVFVGENLLRESGFAVLADTQVKLSKEGGSFVLAGYSSGSRSYFFTDENTGVAVLVCSDPEKCRLIPYKTDIFKRPYADLILSSDTGEGITEMLGIPVLSSAGVCHPFRLMYRPRAYLVTLKRGIS